MHFALPPRKTSQPPPYLSRASRLPGLRRSRLKLIALAGLAFLTLLYLATRPSSSSGNASPTKRAPRGTPPVVLVTVLDQSKYSGAYLEMVRENRIKYAEKHGTFIISPKPTTHSQPRTHTHTHTRAHILTTGHATGAQATKHSSPKSATTTYTGRPSPGRPSWPCATR